MPVRRIIINGPVAVGPDFQSMEGTMHCWRTLIGILVVLGGGSLLPGQQTEPPRTESPATTANAPVNASVERLLNLIDVVLEHHLDPPARQAIVLDGARNLLIAAKLPIPPGLSRKVSDLTTREQAAVFLADVWSQCARAGLPAEDANRAFNEGLLHTVPGGCQLIPAKELKVQQQLQANQYVGIGIALSGKEGAYAMILIPNGPADKAGAKTGEQIEAVDGVPTKGLKLTEVIDRIRGPEGSEVTLLLKHDGAQRTLKITRGVVPREMVIGRSRADDRSPWSYDAGPFYPVPYVSTPIAYVNLVGIGGSTVHELRQIEQKLRADGMQALIIDLQHVEATDPHYAIMLAEALLSGGTIGRIREGDQVKEITANSDCLFQDWPLAVLVDEHTKGTAEWVAAALQDNQRAIVVGRPTPGEAYVRRSFPVPGTEDSLIVPAGTLERPSGAPFSRPLAAIVVQNALLRTGGGGPWGVQPNHLSGTSRVNRQPGQVTRIPSDSHRSPAQKVVTINNNPAALAVELLRKQLGISGQAKDKTDSGN